MSNQLSALGKALADLNEELIKKLLEEYLSKNIPPLQIIAELTSGMDEVGRLFKEEEYFITELVYSGEIFKNAMEKIKVFMKADERKSHGTVVMGTVKDDIHDLGKNIIITMLQGAGFEVVDVGVDASQEKFVTAIRESGASLVGLSLLLTTGFNSMQNIIKSIEDAGLQEQTRIMIGGAVINETIREQMGADYYGRNAIEAVTIAKRVYGID